MSELRSRALPWLSRAATGTGASLGGPLSAVHPTPRAWAPAVAAVRVRTSVARPRFRSRPPWRFVTHTSNGGPKWQVSCHERGDYLAHGSYFPCRVNLSHQKGSSVRQTYFFFLPNQPPPFFAGDAPAGLFAFLDGFLAFTAALADHASASSAASSCAAADSASASCFFRIASL